MTKVLNIPSIEEIFRGSDEFEKFEKRDAMYKVARYLLEEFWGDYCNMANALGVILLTWNQAFYRYGPFDFDQLEECIRNNFQLLERYKIKNIAMLDASDDNKIRLLFNEFIDALKICSGNKKGTKSPVAASKALHILAPDFFPLWDDQISKAYNCQYNKNPDEKYLIFCYKMKKIVELYKDKLIKPGKTSLKIIDEYNYAKFTKRRI